MALPMPVTAPVIAATLPCSSAAIFDCSNYRMLSRNKRWTQRVFYVQYTSWQQIFSAQLCSQIGACFAGSMQEGSGSAQCTASWRAAHTRKQQTRQTPIFRPCSWSLARSCIIPDTGRRPDERGSPSLHCSKQQILTALHFFVIPLHPRCSSFRGEWETTGLSILLCNHSSLDLSPLQRTPQPWRRFALSTLTRISGPRACHMQAKEATLG